MVLIDTSVVIPMLRDPSGEARRRLKHALRGNDYVLTRFTQLEILQGAIDGAEWTKLDDYLADQFYAEARPDTWAEAARIYFDLRRRGQTVRSVIDCLIAQISIERNLTLLHNDRDFETIAEVRSLRQTKISG